jgi:hypothetical protein
MSDQLTNAWIGTQFKNPLPILISQLGSVPGICRLADEVCLYVG